MSNDLTDTRKYRKLSYDSFMDVIIGRKVGHTSPIDIEGVVDYAIEYVFRDLKEQASFRAYYYE